jgi:hypothetical protein
MTKCLPPNPTPLWIGIGNHCAHTKPCFCFVARNQDCVKLQKPWALKHVRMAVTGRQETGGFGGGGVGKLSVPELKSQSPLECTNLKASHHPHSKWKDKQKLASPTNWCTQGCTIRREAHCCISPASVRCAL